METAMSWREVARKGQPIDFMSNEDQFLKYLESSPEQVDQGKLIEIQMEGAGKSLEDAFKRMNKNKGTGSSLEWKIERPASPNGMRAPASEMFSPEESSRLMKEQIRRENPWTPKPTDKIIDIEPYQVPPHISPDDPRLQLNPKFKNRYLRDLLENEEINKYNLFHRNYINS
jgi:hypothetical protein